MSEADADAAGEQVSFADARQLRRLAYRRALAAAYRRLRDREVDA